MKITSFRIKNYKSFIDSGEIHFDSGFNVIIGKNNVGKTALLEALTLKFNANPHKSLITIPNIGGPIENLRLNMNKVSLKKQQSVTSLSPAYFRKRNSL